MGAHTLGTSAIANAIREVFGYLDRYRGNVFVVKIEDTLLDNALFPLLVHDIVQLHRLGIRVVIVPGARNAIDSILGKYGHESKFVNGIRLTDDQAMPLVMLASMTVCQKVLAQLSANSATGVMGNWVRARSLGVLKGIDYGRTGRVEKVKADVVKELLDEGYVPIIPNLGWNKLGQIYNVNSNEVASALCASTLDVAKFLDLGLEGGVSAEGLELPDGVVAGPEGIIHELTVDQARSLLERNGGAIPFAMRDILSHALKSCENGVPRAHVVNGLHEGSVLEEIFSSRGGGTMIYANDFASIRPASTHDIPELLKLMEAYMRMEALVPRTAEDIAARIADFIVFEVDGRIQGCGALHRLSDEWGEIAAIAVDQETKSRGAGSRIVNTLIAQAKRQGLKRLCLLTTQAGDWFPRLGFRFGTVDDLPEPIRSNYNRQRNSRVMLREV